MDSILRANLFEVKQKLGREPRTLYRFRIPRYKYDVAVEFDSPDAANEYVLAHLRLLLWADGSPSHQESFSNFVQSRSGRAFFHEDFYIPAILKVDEMVVVDGYQIPVLKNEPHVIDYEGGTISDAQYSAITQKPKPIELTPLQIRQYADEQSECRV